MLLLKRSAEKLNINLTESQLSQLQAYMDMLLERNEKINLTAITEKDEILIKHFLDSLTLISRKELFNGASFIDIGAGAGFPSIPVKIVRPDLRVTMLDSLNKRVSFLNDVIDKLKLEGIRAVHFRAEDGARTDMRESFDIASARAVADLSVLAEYALPFVKTGGYFIAMKGSAPSEEIEGGKKAVKVMGGEIVRVDNIHIDEGNLNHTLVVIKKVKKTPSKYPRKAGKPSKEPLK